MSGCGRVGLGRFYAKVFMAGRPLFSFVRTSYLLKRYSSSEGVKYHGFTYYPR
jgi:hypothetical protein